MLNDIIEAAAQLGIVSAERTNYFDGKTAAMNTSLGSLFDGAEHLNTAYARTLVHAAFVQAFDARQAAV